MSFPIVADDACKSRLDAEKNSKVKARSYTTLLYPPLDRMADQAALASDGGGRRTAVR